MSSSAQANHKADYASSASASSSQCQPVTTAKLLKRTCPGCAAVIQAPDLELLNKKLDGAHANTALWSLSPTLIYCARSTLEQRTCRSYVAWMTTIDPLRIPGKPRGCPMDSI